MANRSTETEVGKPLPENQRKREITLVGGKTRLGKSYFVKHNLLSKAQRVIICDPMMEYGSAVQLDDINDLVEYCLSHKVFRVSNSIISNFDDLCFIAYTIGNCTLIVEESQRYLPAKKEISQACQDLIFRGGHRAVSMILIMQRFSSVNVNIRSQWSDIYSFRQTEKRDTDWLRDTSGFDLENLETLDKGCYYHITPSEETLSGKKIA